MIMSKLESVLKVQGIDSEFLNDRKIIKELIATRAAKGITLREVAKRMGKTVSFVERMEVAKDKDQWQADLDAYEKAIA